MARSGRNLVVALLVAMLVALPLAARDAAKDGKAITKVNVYSTVTLAGKRLKPGEYRVTANDSKVTLAMDGKVVAEAAVEWKDETIKPKASSIVSDAGRVKEIHFDGKMRYVEILE
jgi:hypothetical protein